MMLECAPLYHIVIHGGVSAQVLGTVIQHCRRLACARYVT